MQTIKSHQDFEWVFTHGIRVNHPLIRMVICEKECKGDPGRVAFAAPKRLGNAVFRNRSKRVLRETARNLNFPLVGIDIILFATARTKDATPQQMQEAVKNVLKRAENKRSSLPHSSKDSSR